eukprot:Blabericola_migrator_1__7699@NODE_392_length_9038_cov_131_832349_g80_i1_p4_GENE_NODE_392_length_9038_cov_131_832349_g80_i1NODE_392_length_9038_cov_131_832349_g80_i1_p4_ORF_typecomplete_len449_score16_40Acyl_transf_3/PF01757_22/1e15_NODE_392_length_9038_cov_131_832349_g80_i171358481
MPNLSPIFCLPALGLHGNMSPYTDMYSYARQHRTPKVFLRMSSRIKIPALGTLKCLATISVYSSHINQALGDLHWYLSGATAVDLFFMWSGMVAFISLTGTFEQYHKSATSTKRLTEFYVFRIPLLWVAFMIRRMGPLWLYLHIQYPLFTIWTPGFRPPKFVSVCPYRLTALWGNTMFRPAYCDYQGNHALWFLSVLALFWFVSPPIVFCLKHMRDRSILVLAFVLLLWNGTAIHFFPQNVPQSERNAFYYAPSSHWQQFFLGVFVWAARSTRTVIILIDHLDAFVTSRPLLTYIGGAFTDMFGLFAIYWQYHIIKYPVRGPIQEPDAVFRYCHVIVLLMLVWSTSLASKSILLKALNARFWKRMDPGSLSVAIWLNHWPLASFFSQPLNDPPGRLLVMIATLIFSRATSFHILDHLRTLCINSARKLEAVLLDVEDGVIILGQNKER